MAVQEEERQKISTEEKQAVVPTRPKRFGRRVLLTLLIAPLTLAGLVAGLYGIYIKAGGDGEPYISSFPPQPNTLSSCTSATPAAGAFCVPASGFTFPSHSNRPQGNLGPLVTLAPAALDAGTELDNPERGPQYYGDEASPPNWPLAGSYERWCWRDIEPQQGQYNFGMIDQKLAQAAAAGYTFGFRIMPINPGSPCMPDYLGNISPNDQQYLDRAQALFTALGQRYNNDPRLGWLDMSLYGCWGEWHLVCNNGGATAMSSQNRQKLIDMQVQAFSNKRFLMLTAAQDSLNYALSLQRSQAVGVRIDCLGQSNLGGARSPLDSNQLENERWKVAPLYFEYCAGPDFQQSLADIKTYHASIIGDGANNIGSFGSYSSQDQSLLLQTYRASGYRFVLNSLRMPSQLVAGATFSVATSWSNVNVAPVYHAWNVMIQLRDAGGQVAWQGTSSMDLQTLLPGGPVTINDQFTLPDTVHSGSYKISIQVLDPAHYYRPLTLAIQGMQPDRSYTLGTVMIN